MSVRQIDGKTVLSYFNASTGNMEVRVANDPTQLGSAARDDGRGRRHRGPTATTNCRRPRTTGWRSRTADTSRPGRRWTSCGCSSANGTRVPRADNAPYRVIQFAVNPFKP